MAAGMVLKKRRFYLLFHVQNRSRAQLSLLKRRTPMATSGASLFVARLEPRPPHVTVGCFVLLTLLYTRNDIIKQK